MEKRQSNDWITVLAAIFVIFLLKMLFELIMEKLQMKKPKEKDPLCVFTDGSAQQNKKHPGYGIFAGPGNFLNRSIRLKEGSHEDGEIQAIIQSLKELLKKPTEQKRRIIFFTDCLFIMMGLMELQKQKRKEKGITKKKVRKGLHPLPQPQEEESFIQKFRRFWEKYENHLKVIENLSSRCLLGVIFVHVPAHHGIYHNEVADILAKMAVFAPKNRNFHFSRLGELISSNKNQKKDEPIGERRLDYVIVKKNASICEESLEFPGIGEILEPEMKVKWKPGTKELPERAILSLLKGKKGKLPRIKDFIEKMERKENILCKEVFGIE